MVLPRSLALNLFEQASAGKATVLGGECSPGSFGENAGPTPHAWGPMKLTAAERERLARMRACPCKHGHLRHDARVYRNATGSLWLDCAQCVRDRVNAYRRRVAALGAQAY